MVQDSGSGIANIQENAEQRAMPGIAAYTLAQGFGVLEGSEGTIDSTEYFAQRNLLRRAPQLIAAVSPADAVHNARAFEIEKNRLQKLFGQAFFRGDVPDFDDTRGMFGEHSERLQCVESSLGDSHGGSLIPY